MFKVTLSSLSAASVLFAGTAAFAQDDAMPQGGSSFQPHTGEPLVYGKKYQPVDKRSDMFLEVNPLRLINRGLGFEFEMRMAEHVSAGADLEYRSADLYESGETKGTSQYFGIAPKIRVYPMESMSGVFFGFKVFLGQLTTEIKNPDKDYDKGVFQIAPTVHAGYRFTSFGGFAFAVYVGGGINLPKLEIKDGDIADNDKSKDARSKLEKENGTFRPDFGLTVGIAL